MTERRQDEIDSYNLRENRVCLKCGRTEVGWRYNRCPNCGEMADSPAPSPEGPLDLLDLPIKWGKRADGSMWLSIGDPHSGYHVQADWEFGETYARMFAAMPETLKAISKSNDEGPLDRLLNVARGCHDYGGGYKDPVSAEIYHHGIATVISALEAAAKNDPSDGQVNALERIDAATGAPVEAAPFGWSQFDDLWICDHCEMALDAPAEHICKPLKQAEVPAQGAEALDMNEALAGYQTRSTNHDYVQSVEREIASLTDLLSVARIRWAECSEEITSLRSQLAAAKQERDAWHAKYREVCERS